MRLHSDFIGKLLKCSDNMNIEDFECTCYDYDRITPLNPWQTSMLLKAKKHMKDNIGEDVDLS